MKQDIKPKIKQDEFWDEVWNSADWTEETEIIDQLMHKSAVDFSYQLLGDINGKELLEVASGNGKQALFFSKNGVKLTTTDISPRSVEETRKILFENSCDNYLAVEMNAEQMSFDNNSFDLVYFNSLLMHADHDKVINECLRVLKPGGKLIFIETLNNWLFKFPYRTFSPYRKSKPKYITLNTLKRYHTKHKEFYLFSTFWLFSFYIFKNKKFVLNFYNKFSKIDNFLMNAFPFLKKVAWVSVAWIEK
jgi:ubiquinone/menaquinone biosynthesis C-methylase UbiE